MQFRKFEEKLFAKKTWKKIVKGLSCLVVFCTVYALILPVVTQEAHAYCGQSEHTHDESCYKDILMCGLEEHEHTDSCYDEQGNLICGLEEHAHSADCYRQVLDCGMEEHAHTLECFSNPDADLEDADDWKVPDKEEGQTVQERIVQVAESQVGVKESTDNYLVENETTKKGISRYGQWDKDPYEDWSGAFVRFVLNRADADEKTKDAKKDLSEWMTDLSKEEELKPADKAEPGDVLFVYDDDDEPKAGIVTKAEEQAVTAIMGDWKEEVKKERFSKEDEKLHSVFRPVAEKGTEQEDNVTVPDTDQEQVPDKEEDKATDNNDQTNNEEVVWDYSKEVKAEDGAIIKVSWNEGTFDTEDVTFQARVVELTEEEQKKVQDQLDKDKDYQFRNYDLTFYVRDDELQLQKVEPSKPVQVEIIVGGGTPEEDALLPVFHFQENGEIEVLKRKSQAGKENQVAFDANSFTVYTIPTNETEGISPQANETEVTVTSWESLNGQIDSNKVIKLGCDLTEKYRLTITGKSNLTIDLNGYKINTDYVKFTIEQNSEVTIKNSQPSSGGVIGGNDQNDRVIKVSQSTLHLKDVTIENQKSRGGGIVAYGSTVTIDGGGIRNCDSRQGGYSIEHFYGGGLLAVDGSTVILGQKKAPTIDNNIANEGGGIAIGRVDNTEDNSMLIIYDAVISNNQTYDYGEQKCNEGGGIALVYNSNASAIIYNATITKNKSNSETSWGGGGIFASDRTYLWLPNGASVYNNTAGSLGGGLTACSTGKMYLDSKMHIYGNHANANGKHSTGDKEVDNNYYVSGNEYNGGKKGQDGYKGEDIFSAMEAEVTGAYSNGVAANWTGIIDGKTFENSKDGFLVTKKQWMLLKANPSDTSRLNSQPVVVTENYSNTHGGGILINGYLVTGDYTEEFIGDYLNLKGTKAYFGEDGKAKAQYNDQFKFGIFTKDTSGTLLATGSSDSNGNISFPQSLYLSSQNTSGSQTYQFVLRELTDDLPGYISPDLKSYDLEVVLTTNSSYSYRKPVWNEAKKCYESTSVTIYRQYITSVKYKPQDSNSWQTVTFNAEASTKTVNVPGENQTTFENREVPIQDVVVNKVWNGDDAPQTSIQVQLQSRVKNSGSEFKPYGKSVTLTSDTGWTYRWKDVPSKDSKGNILEYNIQEINPPVGWTATLSDPVTTQETITDSSVQVNKEVWVPAESIQDGVTYKMVSIDAKRVLNVQQPNTNQVPTLSSDVIPDSMILVAADGTQVLDGTFNLGANLTTSTLDANHEKINALNAKKDKALRWVGTPHAWLTATQTNSTSGFSMQWTDNYANSPQQGMRINSQGYLQGGISSDNFVNITCAGDSFSTFNSGRPVKLYYKTTKAMPSSSTRTVTVQTFILTNVKPKYDLHVKKVDKDAPNKALEGAVFKLYKGETAQNAAEVAEKTTGTDGLAEFTGLERGTYWLKETKQPDGYKDPGADFIRVDVPAEDEQTPIVITVQNELLKYELPETGSTGTRFYTAAGTAMMISSAALYEYSKKRKRKGGD